MSFNLTREMEWKDEPGLLVLPNMQGRVFIRRAGNGVLCGYVGVPSEHPLYGLGYFEIYELLDSKDISVDCHGGLSWANQFEIKAEHLSLYEGVDLNCWFFGFDCAHLYDVVPGHPPAILNSALQDGRSRYRNIAYVERHCKKLHETIEKYRLLAARQTSQTHLVCRWDQMEEDHCGWETSCQEAWSTTVGTPTENRMAFCPFCGGKIFQVEAASLAEK